jgi:hypothetical protein
MHANGSAQSYDGQWMVTIANGLVTKIERLDPATGTRLELSADEYTSVTVGQYALYYAAYYAGIRDYAQAIASGDTQAVQTHYQGMTGFLSTMGQT